MWSNTPQSFFKMNKYEKYFYIILLLAVGTFAIFKGYEIRQEYNAELCSVFWDTECSAYDLKTNICYCEDGEHLTTNEKIEERNALMREMARQEYNSKQTPMPKLNLQISNISN